MTNWDVNDSMEDVRHMERELGYSARCPKLWPPITDEERAEHGYRVIETPDDPVVDGIIVPAEATAVCEGVDREESHE